MKNLSRFDLGMIIAFVVVAALAFAGWWYLSGELQTAEADAAMAASDFDKYSKKEIYLPNKSNLKTLQNNIRIMTAQLDPLVAGRLQSSKNGLASIQQLDTVAWKHSLDDEVSHLNAAAATHGITVPANFYYGFSRYLTTNPNQDATVVLERQQLAIGAISDILINAPVRGIVSVERTYEEDAQVPGGSGFMPPPSKGSSQLAGHSVDSAGGVYTAYPFEFEFDTDTESLRTVVNQLLQSDYVFVIRSVMVQNVKLESPTKTGLAQMVGSRDMAPTTSIINSSPGAVAAAAPAAPTVGLQYLFGDEALHVRMRIDLIDWHGIAQPGVAATGNGRNRGANGARNHNGPGGNGPGGAGE
jgi:hypothetical protein